MTLNVLKYAFELDIGYKPLEQNRPISKCGVPLSYWDPPFLLWKWGRKTTMNHKAKLGLLFGLELQCANVAVENNEQIVFLTNPRIYFSTLCKIQILNCILGAINRVFIYF